MKLILILAILLLHSMPAPAVADDSPCPKTVGKVAIRLFPDGSLEDWANLPLKLGGRLLSSPAMPSTDPNLEDLWIFTSAAPLALADISTLVPSVACIDFTQRNTPLVVRLPDGKCYARFEFRAETTCWSLRVKSTPYGYPFKVQLENKPKLERIESQENPDWNLVKDLPLGSATVEIFDRQQRNLLLVALKDVTYVRLKSDPESWMLDKSKLEEFSSDQDNQIEVDDDAARLVRQRLLQQLKYIHLLLERANQQ